MSPTSPCAACGGPYVAADEFTAEAFTATLRAVVCGHCLGFAHSPGPLVNEDYDPDQLHAQLCRLDHLVGRLPVHKRWRREVFRRDLPLETLVEAVRVAGDVPNIPTIRRHHGSWVVALTDAGVALDARENMFGTQSRALDGHMCYSLGELLIDDWLTHHDIPHDREPPYPGTDLRGDFLVADTIIEFFGLAGHRDYDAVVDRKRQLAREHGLSLLEISREDVETWEDDGAKLLAQHLGVTPRATLPPPPSVGTAPPAGRYETRAQRRQRTRAPLGEPVRAPGWSTDPFGVGASRYTDGWVWTRWIKTTAGNVALHTPTVRPEVARHAWELMDDEDRRYELFERPKEFAGTSSELLEWYLAWMDAGEMHVPNSSPRSTPTAASPGAKCGRGATPTWVQPGSSRRSATARPSSPCGCALPSREALTTMLAPYSRVATSQMRLEPGWSCRCEEDTASGDGRQPPPAAAGCSSSHDGVVTTVHLPPMNAEPTGMSSPTETSARAPRGWTSICACPGVPSQ